MRDNMPNYLNLSNIDPGRVEAARVYRARNSGRGFNDLWLNCPNCEGESYAKDFGGFADSKNDEIPRWSGPSACPICGHACDISGWNEYVYINDDESWQRAERKRILASIEKVKELISDIEEGRKDSDHHNNIYPAELQELDRQLQKLANLIIGWTEGDWENAMEKLNSFDVNSVHTNSGRIDTTPGNDSIRPGADKALRMTNTDAAEILKHLEADIYGRVAIRKAIEALESPPAKEVQEIRELLNTFPLSVEDIRIFAEWHREVGASGEALRDYLKWIREDELSTKVYLVELVSACHALIRHSFPFGPDKVICTAEDIRRLAAEVEK